jgi:hypothetical protein
MLRIQYKGVQEAIANCSMARKKLSLWSAAPKTEFFALLEYTRGDFQARSARVGRALREA